MFFWSEFMYDGLYDDINKKNSTVSFHLAMSNIRCNSRIATELEVPGALAPRSAGGLLPKDAGKRPSGRGTMGCLFNGGMTPAGWSSLKLNGFQGRYCLLLFVENCFLKMPILSKVSGFSVFCLS